jgi:ATP-dependent DNA ligase
MPLPAGFIPPCIPTITFKVPAGPDWIHEIKHNGYRLQVRREGNAVRLFTRRGFDWTDRYPHASLPRLRPDEHTASLSDRDIQFPSGS